MSKKLHRQTKQDDVESLATSLQTCCAYSNSALVEEGTHIESNEYFFRVVEHYIEVDEAKPADLENVAKILEKLAIQFRESALIMRDYDGERSSHVWSKKDEDDDDERMQAREDESRK